MVGGLSRAKGCLEFVEAAALCRAQGADIRFVFVGQSMRRRMALRDFMLRPLGLSQEIEQELKSRIAALGLTATVEFWPFTMNLEDVYRQLDVICFPSHLDAPGRPIFEAALFGVPSIVAITKPMLDTVVDEVTGLVVPPRDPHRLAQAILSMAQNKSNCASMGRNAKTLALRDFDINKSALQILSTYRKLVYKKDFEGSIFKCRM
jgi:glycosyltransferase involved in cell wall biosynthesis